MSLKQAEKEDYEERIATPTRLWRIYLPQRLCNTLSRVWKVFLLVIFTTYTLGYFLFARGNYYYEPRSLGRGVVQEYEILPLCGLGFSFALCLALFLLISLYTTDFTQVSKRSKFFCEAAFVGIMQLGASYFLLMFAVSYIQEKVFVWLAVAHSIPLFVFVYRWYVSKYIPVEVVLYQPASERKNAMKMRVLRKGLVRGWLEDIEDSQPKRPHS